MNSPLTRLRPRICLLISIFCLSFFNLVGLPSLAEEKPSNTVSVEKKIGPGAVWQPGMSFMNEMKEKCSKSTSLKFEDCFLAEVKKTGVSEEILTFIKLIGNQGYLRDFRKVGPVDLAYVEYPFRANENQGCFIVNGEPPMIDIDNLKLLDLDALKRSRTYTTLLEKYPNLSLWPDDRSGTSYPAVMRGKEGKVRIIVDFILRNGCHACEIVGKVHFAFPFESDGKFRGTQLMGVNAI